MFSIRVIKWKTFGGYSNFTIKIMSNFLSFKIIDKMAFQVKVPSYSNILLIVVMS